MAGDYAILAPIYNHIGMATFAKRMTPLLLQYAQQNEWVGRRILDLGSGTGVSTVWFAERGYNITAVDNCPQMTAITREALSANNLNAQVIDGDIRNSQPDIVVDLALALDVINDLDGLRDLEALFQHLHSVLAPNRWMIFDLHTIEGLALLPQGGDHVYFEDADLVVLARPRYDFERQTYSVNYDFFQHEAATWQRQQAGRVLRAYPIQAVASLLRRQGFEVLNVLDTQLKLYDPNQGGASRVVVVARKV